jgi:hypothetical protein
MPSSFPGAFSSAAKRLLALAASLAAAVVLTACGNEQGSPADYPQDFRVVPGDSSAIVSWTAAPGVQYWVFYGAGPNINTNNWATLNGRVITNAVSPVIITGLANGSVYSFTINGRTNNGPGGQGAPTQVITPVLAGENWAPGPSVGTKRLTSIATGTGSAGYAVTMVAREGGIFSGSGNGLFTERTNPLAPADLNGVIYGSFGFVAVGPEGRIIHSLDSVTWASQTSNTTATLHGGTSSVATYVVAGAGGTIATSGTGTAWATQNSGTTQDLYAAAFGLARFVVVGANGTTLNSSDGASWAGADPVTTNTLRAVAFGLAPSADLTTTTGVFVAVGDNGTVLRSLDGLTWTVVTPFTSANLLGIVNGGRFVAVGAGGVVFVSADGLAWEPRASGTTADLTSVARTLSGYTAVGDAGTTVSTF